MLLLVKRRTIIMPLHVRTRSLTSASLWRVCCNKQVDPTLYSVLGLTKDPTVKQIRQAFQTLALQRHPARKKSELSDEE